MTDDKYFLDEVTHEVFVSVSTARKLKKLGFSWGGHGYVGNQFYPHSDIGDFNDPYNVASKYMCTVPTQEVALRYMREEKHINAYVEIYGDPEHPKHISYGFSIVKNGNVYPYAKYASYEEAAEACINKCIDELLSKPINKA